MDHELAPIHRRGGWVTQERRRRKMAGLTDQSLDASNIASRSIPGGGSWSLWVGGKPPFDRDLPGFDVLVLCARELQPERIPFHGTLIRCPIPDGHLELDELRLAVMSARDVGDALLAGRKVLVTCFAGINRSAFVAAMALARVTRMTSTDLIRLMRERRHPQALYNTHFQEKLRRLVDVRR